MLKLERVVPILTPQAVGRGDRTPNSMAIELGEKAALALWPTLWGMLIETGSWRGKPAVNLASWCGT